MGLLTIPATEESFIQYLNASQYIFANNYVFLMNQDIIPVLIPYNATDELLDELLSSVNGVFLTGGNIDLIDSETGQKHRYMYSVFTSDYDKYAGLNRNLKITSTYTGNDGTEIVVSVEHQIYPIYGMINHPEIVFDKTIDINVSRSPIQFKFAKQVAQFLKQMCQKSTQQFQSQDFLNQWKVENSIPGQLGFIYYFSDTFGINYEG
ncbi:gamma-glutamyl hydrolase [Stylonychia lemnae]|uniref:folate gamma-glutamyl hydrolase n=1 Tax=Stylonychia lemnae TaxID=5949 RepID=A0A078AWE0_STYLE|nr:gamma-glutamyl hydrolase [Stylonychia lemnae]|eukprot:CDW85562.1 gamma-glutamyl hydrolase [Stylonychia lemnae]